MWNCWFELVYGTGIWNMCVEQVFLTCVWNRWFEQVCSKQHARIVMGYSKAACEECYGLQQSSMRRLLWVTAKQHARSVIGYSKAACEDWLRDFGFELSSLNLVAVSVMCIEFGNKTRH